MLSDSLLLECKLKLGVVSNVNIWTLWTYKFQSRLVSCKHGQKETSCNSFQTLHARYRPNHVSSWQVTKSTFARFPLYSLISNDLKWPLTSTNTKRNYTLYMTIPYAKYKTHTDAWRHQIYEIFIAWPLMTCTIFDPTKNKWLRYFIFLSWDIVSTMFSQFDF